MSDGKEVATLAGGCFWCIEAAFNELNGVDKAISGYTDGDVLDPTYEDVCKGVTGHAEAVEVHFDPEVISYQTVLEIFFTLHDPTQLNRQGNDVGTQYRSGIYFHSDEQKEVATKLINKMIDEDFFEEPIVTEIKVASTFYPAEQYHQNYAKENPNQGYCQFVVNPKLAKFRQHFVSLLKN